MIVPWALVIAASIKIGCRHEAERETAVPVAKTVDFHHQHPGLGKVLGKVSDGFGMVDYEALKKDQSALDSYLKLTTSVPRAQFEGWTRPQRMAFLINLYNASTIKLMADNFPVKSIKDIGGVRRVLDLKVVRLFGEKYTLGPFRVGLRFARLSAIAEGALHTGETGRSIWQPGADIFKGQKKTMWI